MTTHLFQFASDYLQTFMRQTSAAVDAIATTNATPNLSDTALEKRPHGFLAVRTRLIEVLDDDGDPVLDSSGNPSTVRDDRLFTVVRDANGENPAYAEIGSLNQPFLGIAPAPVPLKLTNTAGDRLTLDWDELLKPVTATGAWWWADGWLGNWGQEARLLHRMTVPPGDIRLGGSPWDSGWRPPDAGMMTITLTTANPQRSGNPVESMSMTVDLEYFHSLGAPSETQFWDDWTMVFRLPNDGGNSLVWRVSRSAAGNIQLLPNNAAVGPVQLQFWLVAGPADEAPDDDPTDPTYWTGP